jgi:hypothetical protein
MIRGYRFALLTLSAACTFAYAQVGAGITMGTGARSLAFGGNHTAVANDLSAAYWNPAALAFMPAREFQLSFDGMRTFGHSDVSGRGVVIPGGANNSDHRDRIRLSGAGAMTAIPTIQGGLTLAVAYERPVLFDDFSIYSYRVGNTRYSENIVRYGDLNRWSGAFGVQVAPRISAGLSVSIITGSAVTAIEQLRNEAPFNDEELRHYYLGYSLTGGALFLLNDNLRFGVRIDNIMSLGVREERRIKWNWGNDWSNPNTNAGTRFNDKGSAHTAPSGAVGVGAKFPWFTAALDLRATMPYTFVLPAENIPADVQARYFKVGGGLGLETPIPNTPVVLRAGYSLDETDLYPIIHDLETEGIQWVSGFGASNRHTLAFGAGFFTASAGIEFSYAWQNWTISSDDGERQLRQKYNNHRAMTSIIFRY